jgi:hypothetical protein
MVENPLRGGYGLYTSLVRSEIGANPPKSPLKRGTKIRILAPFLRGFGGFRSGNEAKQTCVYAIAWVGWVDLRHSTISRLVI